MNSIFELPAIVISYVLQGNKNIYHISVINDYYDIQELLQVVCTHIIVVATATAAVGMVMRHVYTTIVF